jgi:glutaredoxin
MAGCTQRSIDIDRRWVMAELAPGRVAALTVYWRKHCPYCVRLRWQLRRSGLPLDELNIWTDPAAAAQVRAITGGDETVPTVVVGARAMVNPSIEQVLEAVASEAPHLLVRKRQGWLATWALTIRQAARRAPR